MYRPFTIVFFILLTLAALAGLDISRSVSLSHEIAPSWPPPFYSFFLKPLRFVCDMLNHAHNR